MNEFIDFFKSYNILSKKYNFIYPDDGWIGLYGITYSGNIVSKKVYLNVEKPIDNNDFVFLEKKDLYNEYITFIDYNRYFCNCVAKKYDVVKNTFNSYFHIKLNNKFVFDKNDCFFNLNLNKFSKAVSVEFNTDKTDIKRYYYVTNSNNIKYMLDLFKINEDYNNIKYIEYTHNPKKIILIYKNLYNVYTGIKNNNKDIIKCVEQYSNLLNCTPSLFGKYFNSEKFTVYWDIKKENLKNFIKIIS